MFSVPTAGLSSLGIRCHRWKGGWRFSASSSSSSSPSSTPFTSSSFSPFRQVKHIAEDVSFEKNDFDCMNLMYVAIPTTINRDKNYHSFKNIICLCWITGLWLKSPNLIFTWFLIFHPFDNLLTLKLNFLISFFYFFQNTG